MAFLKKWKANWELKSLTFDQLFNIITSAITKQLDEIDKKVINEKINKLITINKKRGILIERAILPLDELK